MIANHIHDALGQVRRLRSLILDRRKFTGYSGTARMMGGTVALLSGLAMDRFATTSFGIFVGWVIILILAMVMNYGALVLWFIQQPPKEQRFQTIAPVLEAVPPLAVGAALSLSLILHHHPDLLYGSWMCLYGLSHTHSRAALPKENNWLGYYYLTCGALFLLWPSVSFLNPLPAAIVFALGEWIGGIIFYHHKIEVQKESHE
jgi:hypothetical protein